MPGLESRLNFALALNHRRREIEGSFQIHGAILVREDHRLLWRQAESLLLRIESDVAVGGLRECPFAHVALGQSGPLREFRNAGGAVAMKGIKEA
jgi:hypothetical protein